MSDQTLFSAGEIQAAHAVPIHPAGKGPTLDEALSNFESDHLFSCREIHHIAEILHIPSLLDTLQVRRAGYDLHICDLMDGHSEAFPPPLIRAASNPDTHVLKSLLSLNRYDLSAEWEETSALQAAVQEGLHGNANILLSSGADPNGVSYQDMSRWSAKFARFCSPLVYHRGDTRGKTLAKIALPQDVPLSSEELKDRQQSTYPRFWAEATLHFPRPFHLSGPCFPHPHILSSRRFSVVDIAAKKGDIRMIETLCEAGADTRAWKEHYSAMPSEPTISFLSPSTPLDQAIDADQVDTVKYLLDKGFLPDIFPLANITSCLNPVMASLTTNPPNLRIFSHIAPKADLSLQTPLYKVHLFHIAVATLSLPTIQTVSEFVSITTNPITALGHTILHISALPTSRSHITLTSPPIKSSIHDIRSLTMYGNGEQSQAPDPGLSTIMRYLLQHSEQDVAAQDYVGNTALHYLASHKELDDSAISVLRSAQGGEVTWLDMKNKKGFTPAELYEANKRASAEEPRLNEGFVTRGRGR